MARAVDAKKDIVKLRLVELQQSVVGVHETIHFA